MYELSNWKNAWKQFPTFSFLHFTYFVNNEFNYMESKINCTGEKNEDYIQTYLQSLVFFLPKWNKT